MSEAVTSSLKTAAKGTVFVLAGMITSQALWFATRLLIVRNLSKEDLGIYSLLVAITGIVSMMAGVGLWEGSTRYISIFLGQGRKNDADAVQRSSLRIGVITGVGACAVIILFSGVLSRYVFYKPDLSVPLVVLSFFIPASVIAMVLTSILRGNGNIASKVYFMDIGQPVLYLVLLCIILLFGLPFINIIGAYTFSMAAMCVLIVLYGYHKTLISPGVFQGSGGYVGELLKFSVPVLSIDVMFLIFRSADILMLGRYGSAEEVGVYSVSVTLAAFLILPLEALWYVYMPVAGELYAKDQSTDLARTYKVLTKWVFSLILPVFFILFFFPEMTIIFLFGERFADSAAPLRILSLGYLFTTFMGANSMLLLVFGLSKAVMKISAAGALLNVLLNYVCIKHLGLGIDGAALSAMVSLLAVSSGYSFVLFRCTGMHPISHSYLKPVIGSAVIGVIIYAVAKNLPLYFWMLPVYFFIYIFGYLVSLVLTRSLAAEDVFFIGMIMKRLGFDEETISGLLRRLKIGNIEENNIH